MPKNKPKKPSKSSSSSSESDSDSGDYVSVKQPQLLHHEIKDYTEYPYDRSLVAPDALQDTEFQEELEEETSSDDSSSLSISWDPELLKPQLQHIEPVDDAFPPELDDNPPHEAAKLPHELRLWNPMWALLNREWAKRDEVKPDSFIVFFGKRGTGKSFAMRQMAWHARPYIPRGFVMTNTPFNMFWQDYFPDATVIEGFDTVKLLTFLAARKQYIKEWNKDKFMQATENPYALIILEDCVDSNNLLHAQALKTLAMNGRHYKIMVMVATQYTKAVGPIIRANVDFCGIFYQETFNDKEAVVENFLSTPLMLHTKKECMHWLSQMTAVSREGIPNVVMLDNRRQTEEADKKYFTYQFFDPGPFKFGSVDFWREVAE